MSKLIYLDNAATTQVKEEVLNEMLPFFTKTYSNPSAVYSFAAESREAVDHARKQAAELIGANVEEIYFTGGGSEADNWALKAAAEATSSMATELVKGKTVQEALKVTNQAVMEALDGLPPVKVHCSLLAEEAIHAALWDYAQKNHIVIEGLEEPVNDIAEKVEDEEY